MGASGKLVDVILCLYFVVMAVVAPIIGGQAVLPEGTFPEFLIDVKRSYISASGDYLLMEKPYFLVGLFWHEVVFLWPISIANVYAIVTGKSWFGTTCLLYGASLVTSMAAVLGEMIGSKKASYKLLMLYVPFMAIGIIAVLRGLLCHATKTTGSVSKKSAIKPRRKLA